LLYLQDAFREANDTQEQAFFLLLILQINLCRTAAGFAPPDNGCTGGCSRVLKSTLSDSGRVLLHNRYF